MRAVSSIKSEIAALDAQRAALLSELGSAVYELNGHAPELTGESPSKYQDAMKRVPTVFRRSQIAKAAHATPEAAGQWLSQQVASGGIKRLSRGLYAKS